MKGSITVRIPATTANLGPGFDALGLALDIWNTCTFTMQDEGVAVLVNGEGAGRLPAGIDNLIVQSFYHLHDHLKLPRPGGLHVYCQNEVPVCSGLGSSATAILAGLMAANTLAGNPLKLPEILQIAADMEGHADNMTAAVLGGLVIAVQGENGLVTQRVEPAPGLQVALAIPLLDITTSQARAALPKIVPMQDAVFNLGRTALVVQALQSGDLALLEHAMQDRLHQTCRLASIPGGEAAFAAARAAGVQAVALSGAGPGIIAFCAEDHNRIADVMVQALAREGVNSRPLVAGISSQGARVFMRDAPLVGS